jgi:outer membrane protein assembly factor BamE (lipoprotein component of BamABCDE complex)
MKKSILGTLSFFLVFLLIGCQTAQAPASKRITSFLGVSLGQTKTQVAAALGNPTGSQDPVYSYSNGAYVVYDTNNLATLISTYSSLENLKGVGVGESRTYVQSILGLPSSNYSYANSLAWYYNEYGLAIIFYKDTEICTTIAIYSGDK